MRRDFHAWTLCQPAAVGTSPDELTSTVFWDPAPAGNCQADEQTGIMQLSRP